MDRGTYTAGTDRFGVGQNLATFSVAVYSDRMLVASPKTWD